jgi:ABC-type phosphate transport system permease subunit
MRAGSSGPSLQVLRLALLIPLIATRFKNISAHFGANSDLFADAIKCSAAMPSPSSDALFLLILAIMTVPHASLLVPLWVLFGEIGLRNSLFGLAIVMTLYQLPFAMFMMRISFEAVPRELEEAALVDGSGTFGVLRRVLLHAVRPGMITVGLFAFLYAWNDFVAPLFMISDSSRFRCRWPSGRCGSRQWARSISVLPKRVWS